MWPDHRLWGLWLFGLLLVPLGLLITDVRPNEIPGVNAEGPGLKTDRLLDDAYYREVDAWIDDRSPTNGIGLWTRYQVDYALLGDSTANRVAVGDDGWAFSRSWVDLPCEDLASTNGPVLDQPTPAGLTWMVPFGKAFWLDDRLEPHDRAEVCVNAERTALRDRMVADPAGIDINLAFDADPEAYFYKRDPHWNGAGRVVVAEALVDEFAPGLWDDSAVSETSETVIMGMDRFLGINDLSTVANYKIDRGLDVTYVGDQTYGLGLLIFQHSRVNGASIPGMTYIFGDSQMASVIPYIEQYFEELIYVGGLRAELGPLPLDRLPAPDRLIVEALDQWALKSFNNATMLAVAALLPDAPAR